MELVAALIAGLVAGYFLRIPAPWLEKLNRYIFVFLAILIMALGGQIGADPQVRSNLVSLGFQALFMTLLCIGGSTGAVWWVEKRYFRSFHGGNHSAESNPDKPLELAGWIGGFLVAGIVVGYLFLQPYHVPLLGNVATSALSLILFAVGLDLLQQKEWWQQLRKTGWPVTLIPVAVLVGGTAGALLGSVFLDVSLPVALATGASSGFYSYSGVFIGEQLGAEAGALAFLTNFFRELLSFFIIPLLASKMKGSLAAIAPGGATTMDTTLPVISRALGTEAAAIALINGAIVSLLVPVVVPLLLGL